MYNRHKKFAIKYWKHAMYTLIICSAIAVIAFGGSVLKRNFENARVVQGNISQNHDNNYNADGNSSQEIPGTEEKSQIIEESSPKSTPAPGADSYLVTVYDGKIAVFKNDETKPMQTLDLPLSILPEEDRQILEAGIRAESIGELKRILEDYQ